MSGLNQPLRLKPANQSIDFTLRVIEATLDVPGDIVECGVYQGDGIVTIAAHVESLRSPKRVWGFDSFEGLPEPSEFDGSHPAAARGWFGDTSLEAVQGLVDHFGYTQRITLVPGFFRDTCRAAEVAAISVLVLDCDLYGSYLDALNCFYDLVAPGGVVVLDEYGRPEKYPGARQATDEFFRDRPEGPQEAWWHPIPAAPRWYVRKPPRG